MKCVKIKVSGKVQGVFFRASTKKEAEKLGLTGFVKNEVDGSVYIEAQGENQNLSKLIDWANKGPLTAKVQNVYVEELPNLKEFNGFVIVR